MMRFALRALLPMVLVLAVAAPASAQVVQSLHLGVGGFIPKGFDSRVEGDVLVENLVAFDRLAYGLDCHFPATCRPNEMIGKFRSVTLFGEWQIAFGDRVEVAGGLGYYSKSVQSMYYDLFDETDGSDIEQDLRLRIIPVTGVVRFLPFGRPGDLQPYVGAGIGAFNWRYSEVGEFVDAFSLIYEDRVVASGTAVGPVVLGGLRIPLQGDIYGLTLEYRYQKADGDIGGADVGFLEGADKIDLGGGSFTVGFLVRF